MLLGFQGCPATWNPPVSASPVAGLQLYTNYTCGKITDLLFFSLPPPFFPLFLFLSLILRQGLTEFDLDQCCEATLHT